MVGIVDCRRKPRVAIFRRAFTKVKTLFLGMLDLRSTMVSVLASGMICGVTGSLLQTNFQLAMPLPSANGGR